MPAHMADVLHTNLGGPLCIDAAVIQQFEGRLIITLPFGRNVFPPFDIRSKRN